METIDFSDIIPEGKQKYLLQFNKANGVLCGIISPCPIENLNTDYFDYEEAELDMEKEVVRGTYQDWIVVDINDIPTTIYESELNQRCRTKIHKRFEPEVQLDILNNVVEQLVDAAGIEGPHVDKLKDMLDYINEAKRANKVMKESYKNHKSFAYISIEQENQEEEDKLEGGLHEVLGPRNLLDL